MSANSDNPSEKEGFVITPGGPRRKELVHQVRPEEAIRIDETGRPEIVPREDRGSTENKADDTVVTPGGVRHKSLVHLIEPGHILDGAGNRLRKLHRSGRVVADFGPIIHRPVEGPLMPANVALPPEGWALGN